MSYYFPQYCLFYQPQNKAQNSEHSSEPIESMQPVSRDSNDNDIAAMLLDDYRRGQWRNILFTVHQCVRRFAKIHVLYGSPHIQTHTPFCKDSCFTRSSHIQRHTLFCKDSCFIPSSHIKTHTLFCEIRVLYADLTHKRTCCFAKIMFYTLISHTNAHAVLQRFMFYTLISHPNTLFVVHPHLNDVKRFRNGIINWDNQTNW